MVERIIGHLPSRNKNRPAPAPAPVGFVVGHMGELPEGWSKPLK